MYYFLLSPPSIWPGMGREPGGVHERRHPGREGATNQERRGLRRPCRISRHEHSGVIVFFFIREGDGGTNNTGQQNNAIRRWWCMINNKNCKTSVSFGCPRRRRRRYMCENHGQRNEDLRSVKTHGSARTAIFLVWCGCRRVCVLGLGGAESRRRFFLYSLRGFWYGVVRGGGRRGGREPRFKMCRTTIWLSLNQYEVQ